jgi:acylphosphatase
MTARRLVVTGRVQGVGFRASLAAEARRLGVTGWVRNRADGTVEVLLEGADDAVARLTDWARHGPRFADVSGVRVEDAEPEGSDDFAIGR